LPAEEGDKAPCTPDGSRVVTQLRAALCLSFIMLVF